MRRPLAAHLHRVRFLPGDGLAKGVQLLFLHGVIFLQQPREETSAKSVTLANEHPALARVDDLQRIQEQTPAQGA